MTDFQRIFSFEKFDMFSVTGFFLLKNSIIRFVVTLNLC